MPRLELRLRDEDNKLNGFRRPRIALDIDREPYQKGCNICITIAEQMGHPSRYIELSDMEARQLAAHLLALADLSQTEEAA